MTESSNHSHVALVRCGWLIAASAVLWGALAWPAWAIAGREGLEGLSIAGGLCLAPGLIVFLLAGMAGGGASSGAWISLAGGGLRLVFVLVGALAVQAVRPDLRLREFLVWLVVFYLATLFVETLLVVRRTG